ncbi:AbrB/MazE/SpoVT family DNA-binding domain-containing protein [Ramlibacter tataouinensis]|nr:AbrB/MazE/SpoVT family DNA-binding domain-containing protein [Ramlibacter tataouinensis]
MTTARLRERRQITLPSEVVEAARLEVDDALDVRFVNGVIELVPLRAGKGVSDMSRFLGAARGHYGKDSRAMDKYVQDLRDGW